MSWVLAFLGFAALIMLHELGHFMAAKAVGMRVERFSLFFPPFLFRWRKKGSETEYTIGAIPLGGYVKITGMTANEELPEDVAYRAYHKQKPWKRIVVIAAGPLMNVLVAFLIFFALFLANGKVTSVTPTKQIEATTQEPAKSALKAGDTIVSVDGIRGKPDVIRRQISSHHCAGTPKSGCSAATPARVTFVRDGQAHTVALTPRYDATNKRTLLGFAYHVDEHHQMLGVGGSAKASLDAMWTITSRTGEALARIVTPQGRDQLSGVVGSYEATRQAINFNTERALTILGIISLSLAIINLFPFLPLDGGHIFWALAEKVRGKPIPFRIIERASVVGFVLVACLFVIGLSNDIGRLTSGQGFGLR